jgi:hypothetical protein
MVIFFWARLAGMIARRPARSTMASMKKKQPFRGFDFTKFWRHCEVPTKVVNPFTKQPLPTPREAADARYIDAPLTKAKIELVERTFGHALPASYVALAESQNGGMPLRTIHRLSVRLPMAGDRIEIGGIFGIGDANTCTLCGARSWLDDWGFPTDIGIYFADGVSGHDMLCLDYRGCGPKGEPAVVHVDQEVDYAITLVAPDFESFVRGLVER